MCTCVYLYVCVSVYRFVCVVLGIKFRASLILGKYSTTKLLPYIYFFNNYVYALFNAIEMSRFEYQTQRSGYC